VLQKGMLILSGRHEIVPRGFSAISTMAFAGGYYIYRLRISGSTGTIVGATRLKPPCGALSQTWIQSDTVTAAFPHSCDATIDVWRYPVGGPPRKSAQGPADPIGATISVPPK
jgi:hypothetical protein